MTKTIAGITTDLEGGDLTVFLCDKIELNNKQIKLYEDQNEKIKRHLATYCAECNNLRHIFDQNVCTLCWQCCKEIEE